MVAVTVETVVIRNCEAATALVEGQLILFSARGGAFLVLNEVGAVVWNILSEQRSVGSMLDSLINVYDVDRDTAAREVIPFIKSLTEHCLLQIVGPQCLR